MLQISDGAHRLYLQGQTALKASAIPRHCSAALSEHQHSLIGAYISSTSINVRGTYKAMFISRRGRSICAVVALTAREVQIALPSYKRLDFWRCTAKKLTKFDGSIGWPGPCVPPWKGSCASFWSGSCSSLSSYSTVSK